MITYFNCKDKETGEDLGDTPIVKENNEWIACDGSYGLYDFFYTFDDPKDEDQCTGADVEIEILRLINAGLKKGAVIKHGYIIEFTVTAK